VIWINWRQQRTETLIAAAILALLALLLVPTGIHMANAYHHEGLSACLGQNTSESCGEAVGSFISRFEPTGNLIAWLTLVPGLVGALFAAPFVLELENGTYRLAWTQSVTRGRWIAGKLAMAIGATLLVALVLTVTLTWWRTPLVHLEGRMDPSVFDSEGTVVFGYALFALGLSLAVGVIWRRAVPALIVSFIGYFAARLFVDTSLRQHLVAPLSATWSRRGGEPASLHHAWVITENPSDRLGNPVRPTLLDHCLKTPTGSSKCLAERGEGFVHAVYQPASHFWALQGIETALFAGVGIALIAFAAWWTHQRTA
jgi:hypothetical protein